MPQVLLVGKQWKARALIRAQLIEEGLDVEAYQTVRDALERLKTSTQRPPLLIADLSESDDPSADLDQLAKWAKRVPLWILASPSTIVSQGLQGRGFEAILFRPLDVGKLVDQIKQRLRG
jgi:CheY-like chemotaxis protein